MDYLRGIVYNWGEVYGFYITEVNSMEIKSTGIDYFSGSGGGIFKTSKNSNSSKESTGALGNVYIKDIVSLNKGPEERLGGLRKVKALLEDLKNTDLIKNKNSLTQYNVSITKNNAGIKVEIDDVDSLKKETLTVNIKKLASETTIASDDISSLKDVGFTGTIEVNGIQININKDDTQNILAEKIDLGEDLNNNGKLDQGEDLNGDNELTDKNQMETTGNYVDGKLIIQSKSTGDNSYITLDGSSTILADKLGLTDSEGQLKNVLTQGSNGEIEINGNKISLDENVLSIDGIKIDLSKAIEGEESVVEVKYDDTSLLAKLKDFQNKYNNVIGYLNNSIKNENGDIKTIKNSIYLQSNKNAGLDVQKGNFYDTYLSLKEGIGSILNDNLKSSGVISDNDGKVVLDIEKIKENIDKIRDNFETEDSTTVFSTLSKKISPYFEPVSGLQVKEGVAESSLEGTSTKYKKKYKLEEIQAENRYINKKIKEIAAGLDITANGLFNTKAKQNADKKDKEDKEKEEKNKNSIINR